MMNYNFRDFRDHDRTVEASNEYQNLSAAGSRQTTARHEDRAARTSLMQAKTSLPHRMASAHEQRVYQEQLKELQAEVDRCADSLDAATAETDRLKRACIRQQLEGPRLAVHQQLTGNILGAARALRDAVIADERFRASLLKDRLPFAAPLESMMPYAGGGPGWIDGLLPVIGQWLNKMEKGDPYGLSKNPAARPNRTAPQPALV